MSVVNNQSDFRVEGVKNIFFSDCKLRTMDRVALGTTKDVHPGANHVRHDVTRFKLLVF